MLVPFIETYVVGEFGWLTATQFVDGIAIGQLTPGPVVMTTAFVGYELVLDVYGSVGWAVAGAFVAMLGAFAPSFPFVTLAFPDVARVREDDVVRAALFGINAAVVGATPVRPSRWRSVLSRSSRGRPPRSRPRPSTRCGSVSPP